MPTTIYSSPLPAFRRVTTPEENALKFRVEITEESRGDVLSISLASNDTGYYETQSLALLAGDESVRIIVDTVDGEGRILTYHLDGINGSGYIVENGVSVNIGIATFDVLAVDSSLYYALPIYLEGNGYNFNFIVDWGDESSDEITTYDSPLRLHHYNAGGTYDITLTGLCEVFSFFSGDEWNDAARVTKILSSTGDMGLLKISFSDCASLNEVCQLSAPLATNASQIFFGCSSLTSVPSNVFSKMIAIENFSYAFQGSGLTTIPADLFKYNINVTDFSYAFQGLSIPSVPDYLFRYNIACLTFQNVFSDCYYLQLKANMFYANGDEDTRFLNQSVNFQNAFGRNTWSGTQGTAPDLWNCEFGIGTPTTTAAFNGTGNSTTSLTNYSSIPSAWINW